MGVTLLDIALLVLGLVLLKKALSRPSAAPLPPGPRRLPLLGNLLDMPTSQEWLTFANWGKKWGTLFVFLLYQDALTMLTMSSFCRQYRFRVNFRTDYDHRELCSSGHRYA
jgi:hypothetical protein